ncbi:hypothetical protein C3L33_16941, partial [Rhododendron williamsianum]
MEGSVSPSLPSGLMGNPSSHNAGRVILDGYSINHIPVSGFPGLKKRSHAHVNRSWIKIDQGGNSKILELDKAAIMRHCSLPARDLRLLDPLFIYPSTILGRENAIVVSLEKIRCIITADEVILMNSLDANVVLYKSELCKRLQTNKEQSDLPFEFRALELALELTCMSLDAQVKELEMEIHPVLDELASSISTLNLERVRRFKGQLLALTQRVQKVCDEIEHLMDDDGDMAEMYLTEKKLRKEAYTSSELYSQTEESGGAGVVSKSAPVSPVGSTSGVRRTNLKFSNYVLNLWVMQLKEYIDDTEDLINIKLGNVQNQLIQFELLLTAATFVATIFAVVAGVFGMNFEDSIFDYPFAFHWVLITTGVFCVMLYISFLFYFRHKKVFPL